MSDQYVGEIRMFAGNFAPSGWYLCNGASLPISGNEVLFMLIGTTYGGDGITSFKLPDLCGRIPVGNSIDYHLGENGGTENVTLSTSQMPAHTHLAAANSEQAATNNPTDQFWGTSSLSNYVIPTPSSTPLTMSSSAVSAVGGNQSHNNVMPSLVINYIIASQGLFPSSN